MLAKKRLLSMITASVLLGATARAEAQDWQQVTAAANWYQRANQTSVVYGGRMWVLGGILSGGSFSDVWYSTNGAVWTRATPFGGWAPRGRHSSVVYNGRMWLMGGWEVLPPPVDQNAKNDVWYSTNGSAWTRATAAAAWTRRENHATVVFDGKIWLIGGLDHVAPQQYQDDVWYSTDGANWTQATAAAGWEGRGYHTCVVADGRMWLMGGVIDGSGRLEANRNDVWSSTDGAAWTRVTAAAGWSARFYHASAVYLNRLWVLGGYDGRASDPSGTTGPLRNDTWFSADGVAWTQRDAAAGWSGRFGHSALVYDNRLWVMGGETPAVSAVSNDVWFLGIACTAPTIQTQPASAGVCEDDSILLTVAAQGDPPPAYQWRKNGVGIPGATADQYAIPAAAPGDTGTYDVEIRNDCGSVISDAAVVIVWAIGTGDVNGDGLVNGRDVAAFVDVIVSRPQGPAGLAFCAADLNRDGVLNYVDVIIMANALIP